jgi:hypothetical protein
MLRIAIAALCLLTFAAAAAAQPSAPGDVMFVGFNADGTDGFAIVTLVDIPDTTAIHFTDNEWTGAALNTGEGSATWTNDTGGTIGEGTVLIFTSVSGTPAVNLGAVSGGGSSFNFGASDEIVWAYLGTVTVPTTFLSAIANDDIGSGGGTLAGTGLTVGTTAIEGDDGGFIDDDVLVYDGPNNCDSITKVQCQMQIADVSSNWSGQDGAGDQSSDMTYPDFPDDVTANFTSVPVELTAFSIE